MATYSVKNQWEGSNAPWHESGPWVLGAGTDKKPVMINLWSSDGGQTLNGMIVYKGEGSVDFKATNILGNTYAVETKSGDSWTLEGHWLIGNRDQKCTAVTCTSSDGGRTLKGTMTYEGEGSISFKAEINNTCSAYLIETKSGSSWALEGIWAIGARENQYIKELNLSFNPNVLLSPVHDSWGYNNGPGLIGHGAYTGEGNIDFKCLLKGEGNNSGNSYRIENFWGGWRDFTWNFGGHWVLGSRGGKQHVENINIKSSDEGNTFTGTMKYQGEGTLDFRGTLIK